MAPVELRSKGPAHVDPHLQGVKSVCNRRLLHYRSNLERARCKKLFEAREMESGTEGRETEDQFKLRERGV